MTTRSAAVAESRRAAGAGVANGADGGEVDGVGADEAGLGAEVAWGGAGMLSGSGRILRSYSAG